MGTTLGTLSPPPGAKRKCKRVGRGPGSGNGTTAGRGVKGQKSRSGGRSKPGFEGGQMPLQRRLPKRGFKNPFRVAYHAVNIGAIAKVFEAGATVEPAELRARGLAPRTAARIKVLADGELSHSLTIRAQAFSAAARAKIEQVGGTAEVVAVDRRGKVAAVRREEA